MSLLLELIENPQRVAEELQESIAKNNKNIEALTKLIDILDSDCNIDIKKAVKALAVSQRTALKNNNLLSSVGIVYCSSSDFSASVAQMAIRSGHGEDALKAMLRSKFK